MYVLETALAGSLVTAAANIRETRWGWRVRVRYVIEHHRDDKCEILDPGFVAKEIAKSV